MACILLKLGHWVIYGTFEALVLKQGFSGPCLSMLACLPYVFTVFLGNSLSMLDHWNGTFRMFLTPSFASSLVLAPIILEYTLVILSSAPESSCYIHFDCLARCPWIEFSFKYSLVLVLILIIKHTLGAPLGFHDPAELSLNSNCHNAMLSLILP